MADANPRKSGGTRTCYNKNGSPKATQLSDDGKAKADNKAGSSGPDENGSPQPSGAPLINPQMASRGAANTV